VFPREVSIRTTDFAPGPDSAFSISGKAELAIYRAFRAKYPDIYPEANALALQFEGAAGEAPLLMSIAGGTAPNTIHVNGRQSGSYIERGFILPLDDYINSKITAAEAKAEGTFDENIMYKDEIEERIQPQILDACRRIDENGDEHYYWLPFDYYVRILAYNKTLFQEVGLDPDADYPKTWDEMLAVARRIQNPDEKTYGMLLNNTGGASWTALPLFMSMESQVVEQEKDTGEWIAKFNDQGALAAADYYINLVDGPWTHPKTGKTMYGAGGTTDNIWWLWDKGQVGMAFLYINQTLINYDSHISGLNPEEVGIVPIPKSPKGLSITELQTRGMGICVTTQDPEKMDAAWKFIRFVGSPEAREAIVRTYVENGYGRFIAPEQLERYGYSEYIKAVPKQWAETLKYSMENCVPGPYGKNCQAYIDRASVPLKAAFSERVARNPDKTARLARLQELYDKAVTEVNEKMLGRIPEATMRYRRKVAAAVLTVMLAAFVSLFAYVWRLFTPKQQAGIPRRPFRKVALAYLMLAPAITTILVFNYYPLLRGAVMAFQDYNVVGGSTFVGLDNFASVLFDKVVWVSFLRTGEYVFWALLLVFVPPILLALILSEIPAGRVLFRVLYYLPAVVSGLVVMLMWKMFFDPTESGMLNQVLGMLGIGAQKWLQDKSLAMVSIIIPLAWAGMGPGCLIYLAALKTVPEDLYEAAAIDGAGVLRRIWNITLPTIKPLILIQLIFVLIGTFQSADNVLVMTGGGPDYATHVVGLEIFYNAYVYLRFGAAVAIAWILGLVLIGLTMLQMRRISRMTYTTAGG
jgi:multiple sugar transport system permease protein